MEGAGGDTPPTNDPSAAQLSSAAALTTPTDQPAAADWANLPPELLRLCFVKCAVAVQGEQRLPLTLQEAAQLLASLSPCRAWREVALAEVTFRLRVEAVQELQHPLLRTLRISLLALPSSVPEQQDQTAQERQQQLEQLSAELAARVPALLSQPSVRERLSRDLALLCFLPAAVAVDHPQLLEGFQRLAGVQLMGDGSHHDVAERVQPSFFPPSVKIISVQPYGLLTSLAWLPARRLDRVSIAAAIVQLRSPQLQLAIDQLSLSGQIVLHASVEALARLDCQHIELTAFSPAVGGAAQLGHPGRLALQPHTADVEQWTDRAARLQAVLHPHPSSPLRGRLGPWALALHLLFAQRPRLQSVRLVGMELQLAFQAEAAVGPEPPGGGAFWPPAALRPSAAAPGTEAADVTLGGLSLSLRVGSKPGTLQLTAQRSAEGLRELAA